MAKTTLTEAEAAVWTEIYGQKKIGLTSAQIENITMALIRDIGLTPRLMRLGNELLPWDTKKFLAARITDPNIPGHEDGFCSVYYLPLDCERITGSGASNWVQWALCMFNFGKKSHAEAPKLRPPAEMLAEIHALGVSPNRSVIRFLSLNMVVFYLAVQTQTWADAGAILKVKDVLKKQRVSTINNVTLPGESVNLDSLFDGPAAEAPAETPAPKSRIPKAGKALHDYNPGSATTPANGVALAPPNGGTITESLAERVIRLKKELEEAEAAMKVEARAKLVGQYLAASIIEVALRDGTEDPMRLVLKLPSGATRTLMVQ